jgi:hypothetical protein
MDMRGFGGIARAYTGTRMWELTARNIEAAC